MLLTSWIRQLPGLMARRAVRKARRVRAGAVSSGFVGLSESLEERALLSSITVTSLADNLDVDGQVTLREAIQAANTDSAVDGSAAGSGADTITFAPNLFTSGDQTITLTQFDTGLDSTEFGATALYASSEISIVGPSGNNGLTIQRDSGNGSQFRLFHVLGSGNLTLENLTLSGGSAKGSDGYGGGAAAGMGGAIFNQGTLTIKNSTLSGNSAIGGSTSTTTGN